MSPVQRRFGRGASADRRREGGKCEQWRADGWAAAVTRFSPAGAVADTTPAATATAIPVSPMVRRTGVDSSAPAGVSSAQNPKRDVQGCALG
jgi:hypothetical protein